MNTVATEPRYGTVDYYRQLFTQASTMIDSFALHLIEDLANDPIHEYAGQGGSRLDRIRNVLAALKAVRGEIEAAGR